MRERAEFAEVRREWDPAEREALVAFYNATGGAEWTSNDLWLSEEPVERRYGILYRSIEGDKKGVYDLSPQVGYLPNSANSSACWSYTWVEIS